MRNLYLIAESAAFNKKASVKGAERVVCDVSHDSVRSTLEIGFFNTNETQKFIL